MKKRLAALGLCLNLLSLSPLNAHAIGNDTTTDNSSVISVSVPDTHKLTVSADEDIGIEVGTIWINNGDVIDVERLSRVHLMFELTEKQTISKAYLNGMDITDQIKVEKYGYIASYTIPSVYQDNELKLEIKSDLPQTGNNLPKNLLTALGALMLMIFGIVAVKKSNVLNRNKKNNK